MDRLLPIAAKAGALLKDRKQTIVVVESSSGGLIAASLLAVPGASAYFIGGAVLYTRAARDIFLALPKETLAGKRPITPEFELTIARHARQRCGASLCLGEHGAAGPTGNRYGDPAGRSCLVIAGDTEASSTIETGSSDRAANMMAFAEAGLALLLQYLQRREEG